MRSAAPLIIGMLIGCLLTAGAVALRGAVFTTEPMDVASTADQRGPLALETAADIKSGGLILYFRHADRSDWPSVIAFDVYDAATEADARGTSYEEAVCLTPRGQEEAAQIGRVFDVAEVPVERVLSSTSCRAVETAERAFGEIHQQEAALLHEPVTNAGNRVEFESRLREILDTVPVSSTANTVIVGHGSTLDRYPEWFDEGSEWLDNSALFETGFYVLQRGDDGRLAVVFRYETIGDFAANAINLQP